MLLVGKGGVTLIAFRGLVNLQIRKSLQSVSSIASKASLSKISGIPLATVTPMKRGA